MTAEATRPEGADPARIWSGLTRRQRSDIDSADYCTAGMYDDVLFTGRPWPKRYAEELRVLGLLEHAYADTEAGNPRLGYRVTDLGRRVAEYGRTISARLSSIQLEGSSDAK